MERKSYSLPAIILLLWVFSWVSSSQMSQVPEVYAQSLSPSPLLRPNRTPLDVEALAQAEQGRCPQGLICRSSPLTTQPKSLDTIIVPSLWWQEDQLQNPLLENWLAYPAQTSSDPRVDLIVNRSRWSVMNYVERYAFVNTMGTAARSFGYNTRIFDRQENFLAAYTCDFSSKNPRCRLTLRGARGSRND
jgi:hypothetical protein